MATKGQANTYVSLDLLPYAQQLTVLLNAVDCFPNGGLYSGVYALEACRRYETVWLPMLAKCASAAEMHRMVPPLDVAFAWLVHRLAPKAYSADIERLFGKEHHDKMMAVQSLQISPFAFTDGDFEHEQCSNVTMKPGYHTWGSLVTTTLRKWAACRVAYTVEPFFPPKPLSQLEAYHTRKPSAYVSALSIDLPASMGRQGAFLHSLLRPCYLERPFLQAAQQRYLNFLQLHKLYPNMTLVPMMDIDLMWHTHMGMAGVYRQDSLKSFGTLFDHDDGIEEGQRGAAFEQTKATYERTYPGLGVYNPPPTQSLLGNLVELFLAPPRRTSMKTLGSRAYALQLAANSAPAAASPPSLAFALPPSRANRSLPAGAVAGYMSPGAGGHAIFLAWRLARAAGKTMSSKWNRLFKSEEKRKLNSIRKAVRKGLGFTEFKHLPLRLTHKYWAQFNIRDSTSWGISAEELHAGVAMGMPAAAPNKQMQGPPAAVPYSVYGCCPGCGLPSCSCRCAMQRYTPFDAAMLPVLVELALALQRQRSNAEEANRQRATRDLAYGGGSGYGYGGSSSDSTFLLMMMYSSTWDYDVTSTMCGDSVVAGAWNDPGSCSSWDGISGDGGHGGAMCGGCGAGAGGDGGGGGCGGGGGGCGGGGGGGGD